MPELFSAPWATAVGDALNASDAYREAAATWDGAIRLAARDVPGGGERAVWLDLHHGRCDETRAGEHALAAEAPFEIAAPVAVWTEVLAGRLDPLMGMMLGKLKVTGDMGQISRHVRAAKEMVACAASVETTMPDAG
ncbi:SCP2 sterol-binding domain-containing protein [Rubrivirga sp.]|uniref:SCP2 sterol-binding domain-containing protein n=1 Tax=Rubrivirga sp. TaxID=1885344 RepID=UPI003B526D11